MKKCLCFILLAALLLCGCSVQQAKADSGREAWPTHAPEATAYIRLKTDPTPAVAEEAEGFESFRDFLRMSYTEEGNFYFKADELEMFRELSQDEPRSFAVYLEPLWSMDSRLPENSPELAELISDPKATVQEINAKLEELGYNSEEYYRLRDEVNFEYALKAAQAFAEAGCETQVKGSKLAQDGVEYKHYLAVVTVTPGKLFELSRQMKDLYFIEQLYEIADNNHNEVCWSSAEDLQ